MRLDLVGDVAQIVDEVKTHVNIIPVSNVGEAIDIALARSGVAADLATDGFVDVPKRTRASRGR